MSDCKNCSGCKGKCKSNIRIIAEAGPNHNGSLQRAMEMVRVAKLCGADTIKFQHIDPNHFRPDLMWQGFNMRELFESIRFTKDQWREVMAECEEQNIGFLCTPQTEQDFEDLLDLGIKEVKISSDNLGNSELLGAVKKSGLPVILSTGMADDHAITVSGMAFNADHPITCMVCTSEYPCPPKSVNILRCNMIAGVKGFSDHTVLETAAVMALALGATVFEKHFTLDNQLIGPDHWWACNPSDLSWYCDRLRTAELMLGDGEFQPTPAELELKKLLEA